MKQGRDLNALAAEIRRQSSEKRDLVAPTRGMEMFAKPDNELVLAVGGDGFAVNDIAHDQLAQYLGIPGKYYDRMRTDAPGLLAANVSTWFRQNEPSNRLVRTLSGTTRAFLSDRYRRLDYEEMAEAILPILLDELNVEVVSGEVTERKLYLKCVDKRIQKDIPLGGRMGDGSHHIFDTCVPAITITNSEVGFGALVIETGMLTRACTNLMFFAQQGMRRRHVGERMDIDGEDIRELLSDETLKLSDRAFWSQVQDVVRGAFNEARSDHQIGKLKAATEQRIETTDLMKVVDVTAKRFGMTETEKGSVLTRLIEGGQGLTKYGLANSITRTAEDLESYDRASEFERLGGKLIDLPDSEWKVIATGNTGAANKWSPVDMAA